MKSTQDMIMWMKGLQLALKGREVALVIRVDKSFEIIEVKEDDEFSKSLMESTDEGLDINDLPYQEPKEIAKAIREKEILDIDNLKVEDL